MKILLFTLVTSLVLGSIVVYKIKQTEPKVKGVSYVTVYPSLTPTPVVSHVNSSKNNQINDGLVNCNVSNQCGGGSVRLEQSVCEKSICCGFSSGKWYLYPSKEQCEADQKKYQDSVNSSNQKEKELLEMKIKLMQETSNMIKGSIQNMQDTSDLVKSEGQNLQNSINSITPVIPTLATQPIDSGKTCYTTWDEYFKAHPGYTGNIQGVGSTPPCE